MLILASQSPRRKELLEKLQPQDVLVCSYGLLVSEADALSGISWNTVVLDGTLYPYEFAGFEAKYAK